MQSQLLVGVGPIRTTIDGSNPFNSPLSTSPNTSTFARKHNPLFPPTRRDKWANVVVASSSSSSSSSSGAEDHYAVLGISQNATSADIKRAYRLLARKYHPDVSKHSQAVELFKGIRHAYEILSNEVSRAQYDRALRSQKDTGRSFGSNQYYNFEVEESFRMYSWDELRRKMQRERYWECYDKKNNDFFTQSDREYEGVEGNTTEERSPFSEVLVYAFMSLFLLQTFGSWFSLTFSSLVAIFDRKLDAGYKMGHLIAWVLGGRAGILLALCLQFASWVCGKTSSSLVALVVVAMWVGSNLARYAPLPQGALLTLLYMSIKLQSNLS